MADFTANDPSADVGSTPAPPPPPPSMAPASTGAVAAPSGPVGEIRNSLAVILLSIITLGIYSLYWQYKSFKEMKDYSGTGIGGGAALVLAIVFVIVNVFAMPAEAGNLYAREGRPKPVSGATGFWILLPLIGGIIWLVKTQGALNRFWESHGATH